MSHLAATHSAFGIAAPSPIIAERPTADALRKVRAYAAQPGATFTASRTQVGTGRGARIAVRGVGFELLLSAREAEVWLSGYITGRRVVA